MSAISATRGAVPAVSIRDWRRSYELLDGLRGIAAFMVLLYHAHALFSAGELAPGSYLAVDVFFVLSGFVLSFAYDRRLEGGLTWPAFMVLRLKRLFPAYLAGLAIAAAGFLLAMVNGSDILPSYGALFFSTVTGLFFLPTPSVLSGREVLYPMNPAAWSIFYELVINFVFAFAFLRLRGRTLMAVVLLGAVALGVQSVRIGNLDSGSGWATAGGGLARVTFSFFAGVLIHRLHRAGRLAWSVPWWVPALAMVASFFVRLPGWSGILYEWVCVGILYPLVIAVAANHRPDARHARAFAYVGALSYPIYILHTPLLFVLTGSAVRVARLPVEAMRPWLGLVVIAVILGVVHLFQRFVERPALEYLRRRPASRSGVPNG